jgi:hypothetical protein
MTAPHGVESLVAAIAGLPESVGPARDAVTLVRERLHLAKVSDGSVELFIEGTRESFGRSALGRALEFGDYREIRDSREFSALLIRSTSAAVRPMAHVAYEALRGLETDPQISNERLLALLAPYLGLVLDRELLSVEQQLGLLGELLFMAEIMNRGDEIGVEAGLAVHSWTGWDSASRDFAGPGVAVEAKVTRSPGRAHWIHPMYQLLSAVGDGERVYVFSVGINVDRSRDYRLITAADRVLDRVGGEYREALVAGLRQYAGVGFDDAYRRQYDLEPGFLITHPPALIRVDHLGDILRPEAFIGGAIPGRVSDLRYVAELDGLPAVSATERLEVLDALLARVSP